MTMNQLIMFATDYDADDEDDGSGDKDDVADDDGDVVEERHNN